MRLVYEMVSDHFKATNGILWDSGPQPGVGVPLGLREGILRIRENIRVLVAFAGHNHSTTVRTLQFKNIKQRVRIFVANDTAKKHVTQFDGYGISESKGICILYS
jgi:hypothetical protein